MAPDRFKQCLTALHWTQRGLAAILGLRSETTVRRWGSGQGSIPQSVAAWLERRASDAERDPLPEGWRLPPDGERGHD